MAHPNPEAKFVVLGGTHGEEPTGIELVEKIARGFPQDMNPEVAQDIDAFIAYPAAVEAGKRFVGTDGQLMLHYPGDPHGSPGQQAAAEVMRKFDWRAGTSEALGIDVHCSPDPDEYALVGKKTTLGALSAALYFRRTQIVVAESSFIQEVPNAVVLESCTDPQDIDDIVTNVNELYTDLFWMVRKGLSLVERAYIHKAWSLKFWDQCEIFLQDPITGEPNETVLSILPDLEAIEPPQVPFSPFVLEDHLQEALGLPMGEYCLGRWGYDNLSPVLPNLGNTTDSVARRLVLGVIRRRINAPTVDGSWATFDMSSYDS